MRPQTAPQTDQLESWTVLKNLVPYLNEFKWRVLFALLFLVGAKLATIGLAFLMKAVVDLQGASTSNGPAESSHFLENFWFYTPVLLVVAYGLLRFLSVIFGEIRDMLFGRVTERTMRRIGHRVFKHLHALDLDFHLDRKTGGLSRDIERGTSGISFLMRFMIFNIVPTLFEICMVIGILFSQYGAAFALVTLCSIVVYVFFSVLVTNWRNRFLRAANKADSDSNTRAIDSLLNYETVKYYTNESFEAKRYDDDLALWESARRKNRLSLFTLNGGQALIISTSMTLMLLLAALGVKNGEMTNGDFIFVNVVMMQLFVPLNFLGFVYREIKMSLINIEQMFKLLRITPKIKDTEQAKDLLVTEGKVKFDQVNFSYQSNREILKSISFEVKSGQTVAIVGPSGSGKSSLVKLLFRFYDPSSGTISIDGQDAKLVTQDSLRRAIGIVPQDTVLFNDSILENIRYGRITASDEEVARAIEMAHLKSFIESLPDGANTTVGERGLKLSGGEKQRVAIARTILKQPKIMVFDEATSSLDSQSEQSIIRSIKEISKTTTSIVIAHRLSTIINSDSILVIKDGIVIEQGDHQTLLSRQQHYFDLWTAQQEEQPS
jgi:ATP-binding cassette subfamily B protein